MPTAASRRPVVLALVLILTGALGWASAFELTLGKIAVLENPEASLSCNFSLLVQCGANLESWQGSVFGFPNPIIGLGGFAVPIVIGFALLAGATFARWFWLLFNLGVAGALAFCIWLMSQSIFVLGTLCPWCMTTWAAVILMFWTLTFYNMKVGNLPGSRKLGAALYNWVPAITIASYLVIAIIAQLRLDVLLYL